VDTELQKSRGEKTKGNFSFRGSMGRSGDSKCRGLSKKKGNGVSCEAATKGIFRNRWRRRGEAEGVTQERGKSQDQIRRKGSLLRPR